MSLNFMLELAWSQVSLFDASLADPFNDWTEAHLDQGFSWRPGSVSFKLPTRQGGIDITVDFIDAIVVRPDARWAIVVPFHTWGGVIEISTMSENELIEIPSGRYHVVYQAGTENGRTWVDFGLLPATPGIEIEPGVLRGDHEVRVDAPLVMDAEPAL